MGKNKSDVIHANVVARTPKVFDPAGFHRPSALELALRRAVTRRQNAVIDANRAYRGWCPWPAGRSADVWTALRGPCKRRWPCCGAGPTSGPWPWHAARR
jgi:hypothetical protein